MSTDNRLDMEKLFDELKDLHHNMEDLYKATHEQWPDWQRDFEEFSKKLLSMSNVSSAWAEEAHKTLMPEAGGDTPKDAKPLSKEEKLAMAKQMKELEQLFDVAQKLTENAISTGAIGPEEVASYLNDFINRILASLPDDNEFKKVLKHLKTRIEAGDEIGSLLNRAQKVKASKTEQTKVEQTNAVSVDDPWGAVKSALLGAAVAGGTLAAPAAIKKAVNSDLAANLMAGLAQSLAGMAEKTEEVEVEEEEEVEVEVEVDEGVEISI